MNYQGMIYRPPSEARSLILQATVGCANNTCTFCKMYKNDNFYIKPMDIIFNDIEYASKRYKWQRVFIADGDALVMNTVDLLMIIDKIYKEMPWVERIASYATVQDIERKSIEELEILKDRGLDMLYIGAETGDKDLLIKIKKHLTPQRIKEALLKAKESGFITSVTLISGLAGIEGSERHAIESAKMMTGARADYIAFLTLYLEEGCPMYEDLIEGRFKLQTPKECLREIGIFLDHIDSEGSVFRANHASNYLSLKGVLNKDKDRMINEIKNSLTSGLMRDEYMRGL